MTRVYRPSNIGRVALCPGSARMSEGVPDRSSPEATEGTRLHALVAGSIRDRQTLIAIDDLADSETVDKCLDFLAERLGGTDWSGWTLHVEKAIPFNAGGYSGKPCTPDVVAIHDRDARIVIVDWKFYRAPLSETLTKAQLVSYAVSARYNYFDAFDDGRVECWAFCPWGGWEYPVEVADFEAADKRLEDIIRAAEALPVVLSPHVEACQYCPARPFCPAAHGAAERLPEPRADLQPVPTAKLEDAYDKLKVLEAVKPVLKEELERRCEAGEGERYEVIPVKGRHEINDPVEARRRLGEVLTVDEIMEAVKLSATKLKATFCEKVEGLKKDREKQFATVLDGVLVRGPSFTRLQRKRGVK